MPGGGPILRADFPKIYASRLPYLKELIGPENWPEVDQQWEQYFNLTTSDRMREDWLLYAGLGLFQNMGENDPVHYDQMLQGPSISVVHSLYGLGFQVGYLAQKHDLDGIISRNAPELGRSLRMSIQTLAANFWNNAFGSTKTADGQSYFSASHTFIRGGTTFSNTATAAALGQSAMESAIVTFRKQKDLMGNPMPLPVEKLVTAPDLEPIVFELTQTQLRHDTTTHAMSYIYGRVGADSWPFLTSSTAWWLLAPKQYTKVYWIWNIHPETTHGFDFDREAAKTKTLFAASTVAVDPRGSYGNPGA